MLAADLRGRAQVHGFGVYNAVAAAAGSLGALAAGVPGAARRLVDAPSEPRWFLLFVPVALVGVAAGPLVERRASKPTAAVAVDRVAAGAVVAPVVLRLSALFALDSFGGGFIVRPSSPTGCAPASTPRSAVIGVTFFAIGLLQTVSFLAAPRLADRFGLLRTMVFTHLPSNVLLAAVAFAPNLPVAVVLLLARTVLSQMDVPTRQAYVMALVDPDERTAAAAYTNTARYLTRPLGPPLAGVAQSIALGAPVRHRRRRSRASTTSCCGAGSAASRCPEPRREGRRRDRLPAHRRRPGRRCATGTWPGSPTAAPSAKPTASSPSWCCEPATGDGDTVVITVWPSHEVFDAWIATPERDALTASEVHQAVDYRPITRYDVVGGYLNLAGLAADPNPTEEDLP